MFYVVFKAHLSIFHFGPEKQLHFRHQLSRYLAGQFVETILMNVDFNNMYGVHRLQCSVVSQYCVFPRCTIALGYLQQVTVVFATPRNYDISSLLFLGPVEALGIICRVSHITKYRCIPEFLIVVIVSSLKTKASSLHVL